jgi:ankyrin repeat protein
MEGDVKKVLTFFCLISAMFGLAGFAFGGEIHEAVKRGKIAKVKILLNQNPRLVYAKDEKGKIPLHLAAERGRVELVRLLLDVEPAVVNDRAIDDITPLHLAARKGKEECVKILLEHGALANARTRSSFTPLHFVALKGTRASHIRVAQMLIDYGGDVNAETSRGSTPLGIAIRNHNKGIVAVLKNYAAKLGSGHRDQEETDVEADFDDTDD